MRTTAMCLAVVGVALGFGNLARAQPAPVPGPVSGELSAALRAEPASGAATVVLFNRPIVVLRARVLGRDPAERAESAARALDDLEDRGMSGPVDVRAFEGGSLISVGSRGVLALTSFDIDELSGETVDEAAAVAAERLRQALGEAAEARSPGRLLLSGALALAVILACALALWLLTRAQHAAARKLAALARHTVQRSRIADLESLRESRLLDIQTGLLRSLSFVARAVVVYATLTFVLRRFPYTRPWGESMRGFLMARIGQLGLGAVETLPGLFTAAVIFLIARLVIRLTRLWFSAVEQGRISARFIYPETAQPTRRLVTTLVCLFAVVLAYPYLPGSSTDAFKGLGVFLGLVATFGSSGLVNQVMSGFMLTYSRALRLGDFVKIGDLEGTVTHVGVLSLKLRTLRCEEVTIPNAVVVAQTTTDFSRNSAGEGALTTTSVTIGYDTPWRQVQALLLLAAERTAGLRREPKPFVAQEALEDFYVKYTLFVSLEQQESRPKTLDALHARIQDLFNEHGVQIMSPNYVLDPSAPKLVARKDWFAAPAGADSLPADTLK